MWSYNATGSYVLVLTLITILVVVLLLRQRRTQKDVAVWFLSAIVGILLGAAGVIAVAQLLGYELAAARVPPPGSEVSAGGGAPMGSGTMGSGTMGSGTMGSGTMGMGPPGGAGGGMGGRAPSPKRELATLVRKVNILSGDIALKLSADQAAGMAKILSPLGSKEAITDDEAKALQDGILALLDGDQKAKSEAIGVPFRRGGGPGAKPSPAEEANPFKQEQNAEALQSLLTRLGKPAVDKPTAEQPKADKPTADKPTADKPKADKPATEKPNPDKPAGDKPKPDKPAADKPAGDKPVAKTP
jgi:hypothetical protein